MGLVNEEKPRGPVDPETAPERGNAMDVETTTLGEMRDTLIEKSIADPEFRARLLADPKAAVKEELGFDVPSSFNIEVHEDKLSTAHLVLPPVEVLDETELKQVSAGSATACHIKIDIPPPSEW